MVGARHRRASTVLRSGTRERCWAGGRDQTGAATALPGDTPCSRSTRYRDLVASGPAVDWNGRRSDRAGSYLMRARLAVLAVAGLIAVLGVTAITASGPARVRMDSNLVHRRIVSVLVGH